MGYDCVKIIEHAVKKAGSTDPAAVAEGAREHVRRYEGIYATYSWGPEQRNGFPDGNMAVEHRQHASRTAASSSRHAEARRRRCGPSLVSGLAIGASIRRHGAGLQRDVLHLEGAVDHHRPHRACSAACSARASSPASACRGSSGSSARSLVGAAFGWLTDILAIRRVLARTRRASLAAQHAGARDHGPAGGRPVVGHGAAAVPAPDPAGFQRRASPTRSSGCRSASPSSWRSASSSSIAGRCTASCSWPCRRTPSRRGRAASRPTGSARCPTSSPARMGALAGFAAGQLTFAYFALGLTLTLNGFIALAVGGLGSNLGALIGGAGAGPAQRLRHATSSAASSSRRSRSAC